MLTNDLTAKNTQEQKLPVSELNADEKKSYAKTLNSYFKKANSGIVINPLDDKSLENGFKLFQAGQHNLTGNLPLSVSGQLDIQTERALRDVAKTDKVEAVLPVVVFKDVTNTAGDLFDVTKTKIENSSSAAIYEIIARAKAALQTASNYWSSINSGIDGGADLAVAILNGVGAATSGAYNSTINWSKENVILPVVNAYDKSVQVVKDGIDVVDNCLIDPIADTSIAVLNGVGEACEKGVSEYQKTRAEQRSVNTGQQ